MKILNKKTYLFSLGIVGLFVFSAYYVFNKNTPSASLSLPKLAKQQTSAVVKSVDNKNTSSPQVQSQVLASLIEFLSLPYGVMRLNESIENFKLLVSQATLTEILEFTRLLIDRITSENVDADHVLFMLLGFLPTNEVLQAYLDGLITGDAASRKLAYSVFFGNPNFDKLAILQNVWSEPIAELAVELVASANNEVPSDPEELHNVLLSLDQIYTSDERVTVREAALRVYANLALDSELDSDTKYQSEALKEKVDAEYWKEDADPKIQLQSLLAMSELAEYAPSTNSIENLAPMIDHAISQPDERLAFTALTKITGNEPLMTSERKQRLFEMLKDEETSVYLKEGIQQAIASFDESFITLDDLDGLDQATIANINEERAIQRAHASTESDTSTEGDTVSELDLINDIYGEIDGQNGSEDSGSEETNQY